MEKRIKIYSLLTGFIFLLSGMGKSLSVSDFSDLIIQYGMAPLRFLAPVIVIIEIFIGLLLVFRVQQKKASFAGLIAIIAFTGIFLYGYLRHDIKDCGCFGSISFLTLPPLGIFIRNGILLYLLLAIWKHGESSVKTFTWQTAVILTVISGTSFAAGYSSQNQLNFGNNDSEHQGKTIQETPLNGFVALSNDSTYLVFVFSYTCSHCLNSIENLKQYEKSGAVDKVIGLAWGDSIGEKNLRDHFHPDFSITNCNPMTLFKITNRFPTAYYIRNNAVELVIHGELPCSYVLSSKIKKNV
jgi:uncharacterized membrane protein YphA (DoxX/SURF4 family)